MSSKRKRILASNDDISLRTYFERLLADHAALFDTRIRAIEKATLLQAVEYERRLTVLNHEHDTLERMSTVYVRDDIYQRDLAAAREAAEKIREAAAKVQSEQAALAALSRRNTTTGIGGVGIAIIGWALTLWLHYARD